MMQMGIFDVHKAGYSVRRISSSDAHSLILNIHYAHRVPSISYAYGLFDNGSLVGVVTYGTPASSTLLKGVGGEKWAKHVIELNRLVLVRNNKNEASRLVGASLRMLPRPKYVVSYADTAQGHEGIVYQATNFLYTGMSTRFKDPKVKGLEHQHHATYAHGLTNKQVIDKYGKDNVYFVERSRKHRYIIILGNKYQRRDMMKDLKYPVLPYPSLGTK